MWRFFKKLFGFEPEISLDLLVRSVVAEAKGLPATVVDDATVLEFPETGEVAQSLAHALQLPRTVFMGITVGMTVREVVKYLKDVGKKG